MIEPDDGRSPMHLRALRLEDEREARAAHAELAAEGFAFLPLHDPDEPWAHYLDRVARQRTGADLPPGYVPWTDLYGVVDGVVVGCVSVRHRLTDALRQVGGHIGYAVRVPYRRRGYATALLRAGLDVAHDLGIPQALVTCDDTNVGSRTVIERCGGVLQDVVPVVGGPPKRRYRVPTAATGRAPTAPGAVRE